MSTRTKVRNPESNRKILVGGGTYKRLLKKGEYIYDAGLNKFILSSMASGDDITIAVNVETGRKIKKSGRAYNKMISKQRGKIYESGDIENLLSLNRPIHARHPQREYRTM